VLYFLLAAHDECQCGGLHPPHGEELFGLRVSERIEARAVHPQEPVTLGTAQARQVEVLVGTLVLELAEALTDGLVGHGGNPQSLHGAIRPGLLQDPPLDQLALLPCIAAIDDAVRRKEEFPYDPELFLDTLVVLQMYVELIGNHREIAQIPTLPLGKVFGWGLQLAQVAEGPSHLVAIPLQVAVFGGSSPEDAGDVACHAGFLCDANNHILWVERLGHKKRTGCRHGLLPGDKPEVASNSPVRKR